MAIEPCRISPPRQACAHRKPLTEDLRRGVAASCFVKRYTAIGRGDTESTIADRRRPAVRRYSICGVGRTVMPTATAGARAATGGFHQQAFRGRPGWANSHGPFNRQEGGFHPAVPLTGTSTDWSRLPRDPAVAFSYVLPWWDMIGRL